MIQMNIPNAEDIPDGLTPDRKKRLRAMVPELLKIVEDEVAATKSTDIPPGSLDDGHGANPMDAKFDTLTTDNDSGTTL